MQYECECFFNPGDAFDACCPIHNMPRKLGSLDYQDLEWAHHELSIHGVFGVDELDNEG